MCRLSTMPFTGRATIRATSSIFCIFGAAVLLSGCAMKMPSFSGIGLAKSKSSSKSHARQASRGIAYDGSRQSSGNSGYRPASPWVWSKSGRGTREITVKPGESLYGIASRRNVAISEIMAANGMSGPAVTPGQRLIVPVSNSAPAAARIARYVNGGTSTKERFERDSGRNDRLFERSRSTLGRNALTQRTGTAPVRSEGAQTYRVRPGDTLYGIARRNGVNPARLASHNGLSDPSALPVGMSLQIPR